MSPKVRTIPYMIRNHINLDVVDDVLDDVLVVVIFEMRGIQ